MDGDVAPLAQVSSVRNLWVGMVSNNLDEVSAFEYLGALSAERLRNRPSEAYNSFDFAMVHLFDGND